jgi:hypothetical protein
VSGPTATASLIEDRGEAARAEDFFRSRPFLDAEGVTHTLCIETPGGGLLAPLVVREVPGRDAVDATSPYGYPGFSGRPRSPIDPAAIDFSATGLVSIFLRHAVGEPALRLAKARNVVQVADPELAPKSRMSDRQQIRKNLRRGYELRIVPGPETSDEQRDGFLSAYEETMRRTAAADRYFFGTAYFDRILESPATWLALALAPDGTVAAASIAAASDGFLHYYLSGTADSHLRDSPMKNVVAGLVELSAEQGLPLNLGGGIERGDRLEEFKRGFANRELTWHTSELVCDPEAYARLAPGKDAASFFPAYRAS